MPSFPLQRAVTGEELPECEVLFLESGADIYEKAKTLAGGRAGIGSNCRMSLG